MGKKAFTSLLWALLTWCSVLIVVPRCWKAETLSFGTACLPDPCSSFKCVPLWRLLWKSPLKSWWSRETFQVCGTGGNWYCNRTMYGWKVWRALRMKGGCPGWLSEDVHDIRAAKTCGVSLCHSQNQPLTSFYSTWVHLILLHQH